MGTISAWDRRQCCVSGLHAVGLEVRFNNWDGNGNEICRESVSTERVVDHSTWLPLSSNFVATLFSHSCLEQDFAFLEACLKCSCRKREKQKARSLVMSDGSERKRQCGEEEGSKTAEGHSVSGCVRPNRRNRRQ